MRELWVFAVLVGSVACGSHEEVVFTALPDSNARSVVFATRTQGRIGSIEAINLDASSNGWRLPAEDGVLVEALFYDTPLADIGLEVGPVPRGPAESRRRLPDESTVFELQLTASGPSSEGWVMREQRSSALDALRLPEDGSECPRIFASNYGLPSPYHGAYAGRLPSGEVILGDFGVGAWITDGQNLSTLRRQDGEAFALVGLGVAPDTGLLYFSTVDAQIRSGTIDGDVLALTYVTKAPADTGLRFIDVVTSSSSLELYAMSEKGKVLHYANRRWELIHDFQRSGFPGLQGFIRIEHEDGREILAVAAEDNRVVSIRDGIVEMQETTSGSGLVEIAEIEGVGPVAGNDLGQLFARIDGRWESLGPTGLYVWATVVAPVEPGLFMVATAFGNLELFFDRQPCGAAQLLPGDPFFVVPVGPLLEHRFIAFGDRPANGDLWYSEIRVE